MLVPFMPSRVQRITAMDSLSVDPPDLHVHRWGQYKADVPSLGAVELAKIDAAAAAIVASFDAALAVRIILLQGHADYDHLKSGKAREDFELKVSQARAHEVRKALQVAIEVRACSHNQKLLAWILYWKEEGFGSHRRRFTSPKNEQQRSMNRRVEGFFARGVRPHPSGSLLMSCPHGGRVTRAPYAPGLPSTRDAWLIVGCMFRSGEGYPSPCIYVRWSGAEATPVIDRDSIGHCCNIHGASQGAVVIY